MTLRVQHVTFDCEHPLALAEWWATAIGGAVAEDWGEFVTVDASAGGVSRLGFQRVPEAKAGKNRLHLDLHADDAPAEVARLVVHGARVVDEQTGGPVSWTVLQDPAGNEFCVN